jgi:hypothetical protein
MLATLHGRSNAVGNPLSKRSNERADPASLELRTNFIRAGREIRMRADRLGAAVHPERACQGGPTGIGFALQLPGSESCRYFQ